MVIDISIDLETLSTRPNAVIIAIGAVMIDRESGEIIKTFYRNIQPAMNDRNLHLKKKNLGTCSDCIGDGNKSLCFKLPTCYETQDGKLREFIFIYKKDTK